MSTTHGAETHCLAAGLEVMRTYQNEPVIARMNQQGRKLADGLEAVIAKHDLSDYVAILGRHATQPFFGAPKLISPTSTVPAPTTPCTVA